MANLIDTHFHLDMYKNHAQIFQYLNENQIYTLCMTNSPGVYLSCQKLYGHGKYVKFAMGFHPLEESLLERDLSDFLRLLDLSKYVGEIGLDYSGSAVQRRSFQKRSFEKIVSRCSEQNKLMSVHIKKAEEDAIETISKYRPRRCIIHWFSGNQAQLQQLIDCGCYFSINTNMVRSTSNLLLQIPSDRLLVESDGPFSRVDGKKYKPELLLREYEIIALALNKSNLISTVYENFRRVLSD